MITPFDDFTMPIPFCGCKVWLGGTNGQYGQYWDGVKKHRAHVYAYERKYGPVPKGKMVCHTCDMMVCVEEDHLYAGTHQSNMDDKERRGRGNHPTGVQHGRAKLTTVAVAAIASSDLKLRELADMFGISIAHASRIKRGER